jgi:MFS family permease
MPLAVNADRTERNVFAFGATSFFNDTASEMAYWVLPAFLASIGAGPAQLGIIEGIAESIASFAKLFSGVLADRVSRRKPIVVSGYVVANSVKPLLALASSWWHVLGVRFADRLAKGVRGAPRDVMLAESTPPDKIGSAFGLLQAMDSAGAISGPLLALAIMPHFGFRGVFLAAAAPGALAVIAVVTFVRERREHPRTATEKAENAKARLTPAFYYFMLAVGLFSIGNSSDMFLVLRAQNVGIAITHAPLLGLVFNITYTLFSWPAGKWSDRAPRRVIAAAGLVVFAIVYGVFAIAPSRAAIWAAMAFYGLYYALTAPVLKAIVADAVPRRSRGSAFGVFYFVTSVNTLLASVLTGQLWTHLGARTAFAVSATLALVAALMLLARSGTRTATD